ncbi:mechanosensitive ion channel domain-containing protein [Lyngbya aestuarii]|uniref:mechanosensitive ion channel domain-containing protein n=1 Tax=Lyngbya aestuarii TaxID=118322 RepID=UPI00403D5D46
MNILVILAEVSLVVGFFFLLNWLSLRVFKQTMKVPWLKQRERRAKILRRKIQGRLVVCCIVFCLVVVSVNGVLIYRGENLQRYTLGLMRLIPSGFWVTLATGTAKSVAVLIAVAIALRILRGWLDLARDRAENFEQLTANDESIENFFSFFKINFTNSIWLLSIVWCTQFFRLSEVVTQYLYVLLRIYVIIALGLLIFKATAAIIDSLDALSDKYDRVDNFLGFYDRLRHLVPFLKRCLEYIIYVSMATLVVGQVELIADLASYGPKIIKIIGIVFLSRVLVEVAHLLVEEALLKNQNITDLQRQRRLTLIPLLQSALRYIIYFCAGISILEALNIDPTPILAAAGIIGLAVGLGAQNLINDIVCGFFILFENYYLVGDFIETNEAKGIVEAIDLRTTRIRHPNGQQHIIRHGQMEPIINYSKQYIYAVVEVGVAYDSSLDHVYRVIEEVGLQLKEQYSDVLEATLVDGLDKFGESELLLRTVTKVKPGKHLPLQRVLRKMIKDAFDREGIEIPFARRVLIFKNQEESNQSVTNDFKSDLTS